MCGMTVAFGRRLHEVRVERGFSQEELGERAGMRSNAIGRLERGGREPRISTVLRLARGLGVAPGTLLDQLVRLV